MKKFISIVIIDKLINKIIRFTKVIMRHFAGFWWSFTLICKNFSSFKNSFLHDNILNMIVFPAKWLLYNFINIIFSNTLNFIMFIKTKPYCLWKVKSIQFIRVILQFGKLPTHFLHEIVINKLLYTPIRFWNFMLNDFLDMFPLLFFRTDFFLW